MTVQHIADLEPARQTAILVVLGIDGSLPASRPSFLILLGKIRLLGVGYAPHTYLRTGSLSHDRCWMWALLPSRGCPPRGFVSGVSKKRIPRDQPILRRHTHAQSPDQCGTVRFCLQIRRFFQHNNNINVWPGTRADQILSRPGQSNNLGATTACPRRQCQRRSTHRAGPHRTQQQIAAHRRASRCISPGLDPK